MRLPAALAAAALALGVSACQQPAIAAEKAVAAPAAKRVADEGAGLKTAIFAGGCFWGVEGVFAHVKGVISVESGYHGGSAATARYELTHDGKSGHAEAVRIVYDPSQVSYGTLLRILFSVIADPTLKDRQGPDAGSQYRAAIVPQSREQAAVAAAYLQQLRAAKLWSKPIVTRIEKARTFYPAETYHQDFMLKNPRHGYIVRWDAPKVKALKAMYPGVYAADFQPG